MAEYGKISEYNTISQREMVQRAKLVYIYENLSTDHTMVNYDSMLHSHTDKKKLVRNAIRGRVRSIVKDQNQIDNVVDAIVLGRTYNGNDAANGLLKWISYRNPVDIKDQSAKRIRKLKDLLDKYSKISLSNSHDVKSFLGELDICDMRTLGQTEKEINSDHRTIVSTDCITLAHDIAALGKTLPKTETRSPDYVEWRQLRAKTLAFSYYYALMAIEKLVSGDVSDRVSTLKCDRSLTYDTEIKEALGKLPSRLDAEQFKQFLYSLDVYAILKILQYPSMKPTSMDRNVYMYRNLMKHLEVRKFFSSVDQNEVWDAIYPRPVDIISLNAVLEYSIFNEIREAIDSITPIRDHLNEFLTPPTSTIEQTNGDESAPTESDVVNVTALHSDMRPDSGDSKPPAKWSDNKWIAAAAMLIVAVALLVLRPLTSLNYEVLHLPGAQTISDAEKYLSTSLKASLDAFTSESADIKALVEPAVSVAGKSLAQGDTATAATAMASEVRQYLAAAEKQVPDQTRKDLIAAAEIRLEELSRFVSTGSGSETGSEYSTTIGLLREQLAVAKLALPSLMPEVQVTSPSPALRSSSRLQNSRQARPKTSRFRAELEESVHKRFSEQLASLADSEPISVPLADYDPIEENLDEEMQSPVIVQKGHSAIGVRGNPADEIDISALNRSLVSDIAADKISHQDAEATIAAVRNYYGDSAKLDALEASIERASGSAESAARELRSLQDSDRLDSLDY